MRATGELKFTKHPDGMISHEWTGGRRVAINSELLRALGVPRPYLNRVIRLKSDVVVRVVDMQFTNYGSAYDAFIVMREGWLARFVAWYVQWIRRVQYSTGSVSGYVVKNRQKDQCIPSGHWLASLYAQ